MRFLLIVSCLIFALKLSAAPITLQQVAWQESDAALVVANKADSSHVGELRGEVLLSWNSDAALIPASLAKLATSYLAIEKWGVDHRFHTEFYVQGNTLWVRGLGDPFLVSEELTLLVDNLRPLIQDEAQPIRSIEIDNSYFDVSSVPGRTTVSDPYNAPLSAVSANFNTVYLEKINGNIRSAETQTPLVPVARKVAPSMRLNKERVNLVTQANAQQNFAELLGHFLGLREFDVRIDARLPESAALIYTHSNSRALEDVLVGAMKYSNNFIANQVFLKLADAPNGESVSFEAARKIAQEKLKRKFGWDQFVLEEGAGLSRSNRLNADQIDDLLRALAASEGIFSEVKLSSDHAKRGVKVSAKTGTLNGVRSYAGYIHIADTPGYRFVFNFNRKVPYQYREKVLGLLIDELLANEKES